MSVSVENFIKTIYTLEHRGSKDTKLGNISKILGISNAASTDMARKLALRNLIHYQKYQPIQLTDAGNKMALILIRKHRLWESFLFKIFDMSLHEIHREAELLEHQTSNFLADRIHLFLGKPKYDPHGDPIPDSNGNISYSDSNILLSEAEPGQVYQISRLSGTEKDFFDFCYSNHLHVDSTICVEKQYISSRMTEITIKEARLLLNKDFTSIIYVRKSK